MVKRLALEPPIDVEAIAAGLATVTEKTFPVGIDGLCLDLKKIGKKPKVWISRDLGRVRRRFTLAHEIGHIVIPWHTGSIVDDLDAPHKGADDEYLGMEAEANRFAAELLMPTAWVKSVAERSEHAAALMNTIVQVADVSYPAALFRTKKLGPSGFIVAEVQQGRVIWSGRTANTRVRPPLRGTEFAAVDMPVAYEPHCLFNNDSQYVWWKIREGIDTPVGPTAPWREILTEILISIPSEHREITRSRANAVIGYAIGKLPKGTSADLLYQRAVEACQNRSDRDKWLAAVIAHRDFPLYLLARARERADAAS